MKKLTNKAVGTLQVHDVSLNLLKANDYVAEMIRKQMFDQNILLINLVSSPGSGKTSLLEETIKLLKDRVNIAVLEGDLQTERDAERIRKHGIQALQIVTGGICHLEAQMIQQAMPNLDLSDVDILFIENVGNLVCPASYDLGEDIRVTLVSVTEGDDKPKKYPSMFLTTDIMLVTKSDLLPYVPFSVDAVIKDAHEVNAAIQPFVLSSMKGDGMEEWCDFLIQQLATKRETETAT
ncbi:MAG: hydrogenase nickel incorporation protein HypB [Calditrichia bacterium]|nr:hydrogenase nickel incorporation protein HypB [Calditrichota bacterium]MCB0287178.1 hydrogenase nickel incorporation protein HypB [Calditrichota bacterium]MCB9069684.1 hydrogenase nickel incorporation protein HypB [Calditrichia bacterium]